MSELRNYTLYRFEDGKRIVLIAGPDPCPLLTFAERMPNLRTELVSPDGEVVWPDPKDGGEPFIERSRRR